MEPFTDPLVADILESLVGLLVVVLAGTVISEIIYWWLD